MTANLGQKETSMIWYSDICQVLNWVTVNSLNSEENYHCKAGKDVLLWEEESTGNRQRQDLNPGLYDTGLSCWLCGKESACQCRRPGLILESERSPEEGNGSSLQCSCLGKPMDREAWWATVHGVAELDTTGQATAGADPSGRRHNSRESFSQDRSSVHAGVQINSVFSKM